MTPVTVLAARPLNPRQKKFGVELGVALAGGDRNFAAAYAKAGYKSDRGNAARLAADPRVKAVADEVAQEAVRLSGLHLAYLQAKGLQLLEANVLQLQRRVVGALERDQATGMLRHKDLAPDDETALFASTWALSEIKIDADGAATFKIPDKKGVIEMLFKTMPQHAARDGDGASPLIGNLNINARTLQMVGELASLPENEIARRIAFMLVGQDPPPAQAA